MILTVILRWFAFPPPVDHIFQNSLLWPVHLGWPCTAWLITLQSYAHPFATRQWSLKGKPSLTHPLMMLSLFLTVSSVQLLSHVQLFATPWTAARQTSLSLTISWIYPSSCSLHQWCSPAISYSEANFSFWPQSFPASRTFPVSVWSHQMTKILEFQLQH